MDPHFEAGDVLVVRERWRDRLWSAVPHRLVSGAEPYVTYVPEGTLATYASNRDLPGTRQKPRGQRKLAALETCVYEVVERRIDRPMLHFFTPGSWARVNLGWTVDHTFTGWYVNLERPLTVCPDGLETMDLVLDLCIDPDGRARWKDRDEFDDAVARGLHPADLLPVLEAAVEIVLDQQRRRSGPFDRKWRDWVPDPAWEAPVLPAAYRPGGPAWSSALADPPD